MGESAGPRASIADRERALRELTQHLGAGRLTLAEFDELSAAVAAAGSKTQLAELFAELPGSTPPPPEAHPTDTNPLPRLAVLAGAAIVFAVVLALSTGNWLWLLVISAAPVLFKLTARAA